MTAADFSSASPTTYPNSTSAPLGDLVLRFLNTEHAGQWVRLGQIKCSVGSSEECSLSLRTRFVQPLHALIVRGRERTIVRSYAADSRLNGRPFESTALAAGDTISFGTVDLMVAALHLSAEQSFEQVGPVDRNVASRGDEGDDTRQQEIDDALQSLSRAKQVNRARTRRLICDLRDANERIVEQQDRLTESNRRGEQLETRLNALEDRLAMLQTEYESLVQNSQEILPQRSTPGDVPSEPDYLAEQTHNELGPSTPHDTHVPPDFAAYFRDDSDETSASGLTSTTEKQTDAGDRQGWSESSSETTPSFSTEQPSEESDEFASYEDDSAAFPIELSQGSSFERTGSPFFEANAGDSSSEPEIVASEVPSRRDDHETMSLTPELAEQLGIPYTQLSPLASAQVEAESDTAVDGEGGIETFDHVTDAANPSDPGNDSPHADQQLASLRANLAGLLADDGQAVLDRSSENSSSESFPEPAMVDAQTAGDVGQSEQDQQVHEQSSPLDSTAEPEPECKSDTKPIEEPSDPGDALESTEIEIREQSETSNESASISIEEDEVIVETTAAVEPETHAEHMDSDDDDDESIESYMAKLLQRVRGESDPAPTTPSRIAPPPSLKKAAETSSKGAAEGTPTLEQAFADEIQARQREFSTPKVMRRTEAPENRDELAVMRELANTSARSAIKESQQRRETQLAAIHAGGAVLAILAGAALIGVANSLMSLPVLAALGCWGAAGYCAYRAIAFYRIQTTATATENANKVAVVEVEIVPPDQVDNPIEAVPGDQPSMVRQQPQLPIGTPVEQAIDPQS